MSLRHLKKTHDRSCTRVKMNEKHCTNHTQQKMWMGKFIPKVSRDLKLMLQRRLQTLKVKIFNWVGDLFFRDQFDVNSWVFVRLLMSYSRLLIIRKVCAKANLLEIFFLWYQVDHKKLTILYVALSFKYLS
mgnify:CR=1 FL=1